MGENERDESEIEERVIKTTAILKLFFLPAVQCSYYSNRMDKNCRKAVRERCLWGV